MIPPSRVVFALSAWLVLASVCFAQSAQQTIDSYVAESVRESEGLISETLAEWTAHHKEDVVESPEDKGEEYAPENAYNLTPRQQEDHKLEGRWCLHSVGEKDLAGGIHVRRVALFYQPLVEHLYGKPLPPLPTETGDELRKHGCKLVKIMYEFDGISNSEAAVKSITASLPGKRVEEPGKFIEFARDSYWNPICTFENFGRPIFYHEVYVHGSKASEDGPASVLLLEMQGALDYGQASSKTINPEAGQPWLEMRAAKAADLPEGPTLDMLSFLAPQVGDLYEQAPLWCHRQLVPILRAWFDLAARSKPEQQAAAILLADRVLDRLSYCEEFDFGTPYRSEEDQKMLTQEHDALEKDLQELGIKTELPARLGTEYYAGNLMDRVLNLAPNGPVNELAHMAILNRRCQLQAYYDSVDCRRIIEEGEQFLSRHPEDEWTQTVHLILAEAYGLTSMNPEEPSADPQPSKTELRQRAAAHYRAWYARSSNERDRTLVWQEIWALDAGMGPWLMMPAQSEP